MMAETPPDAVEEGFDIVGKKQPSVDLGAAFRKRQIDVGFDGPHLVGDEHRRHQFAAVEGDRVIGLGDKQKALELLRLQILIFVQCRIGEPKRNIEGVFHIGGHLESSEWGPGLAAQKPHESAEPHGHLTNISYEGRN